MRVITVNNANKVQICIPRNETARPRSQFPPNVFGITPTLTESELFQPILRKYYPLQPRKTRPQLSVYSSVCALVDWSLNVVGGGGGCGGGFCLYIHTVYDSRVAVYSVRMIPVLLLFPSLASECAPPPRTGRGGGAHLPAGEGLGESQFRPLEKKLSILPTLCPICFEEQRRYS